MTVDAVRGCWRCVRSAPAASGEAADERTVWKYDKGTFEKQPDGKWVQKEGDKTHEYQEKQNFPTTSRSSTRSARSAFA